MSSDDKVSPATTTKNWEKYQAFQITTKEIQALWTAVSQNSSHAKLTFGCSDGSAIATTDADSVLKFPNSRTRSISRIEFDNGYGSDLRIRVVFESTAGFSKIQYQLAGDDKAVLHKAREIEEIIETCRVWYSSIAASPFARGALTASFYFIGFIGSFWAFVALNHGTKGMPRILNYLPILLSPFYLVALLANRWIPWMFPPAVFAIGDGIRRARNSAFLRRFVGVTLLAGLILSVAGRFVEVTLLAGLILSVAGGVIATPISALLFGARLKP
jgi:hypothetical protein